MLRTCSRFNNFTGEKVKQDVPRVHIKDDKVLKNSSTYGGKIKVSVRKLLKTYVRESGIALNISEIINHKNWKSAWLILLPDKYSNYIGYHFYWKHQNRPVIIFQDEIENENLIPDEFWVKNDFYLLKLDDKRILLSIDD